MADPSVEQKAEELARAAADRAARLALIDAEEKTKLAVDRAVKDALIDRELHDHSKAEELARAAADRAARLALIDAEEKTKLAVDRAVKDALIDRELHDHSEHLKQINHSQEKAAASLISLQTSFDELSISNQAVAKYVTEQSAAHFSRRTLWLMAIGGLGGYAGLIALLISNHP